MLNVTELRSGIVFKEDSNLYQVIVYEHIKMGRGSGNIKVKVRNLRTGAVVEKSFITGARVDDTSVDKKNCQFLYSDGQTFNFMDNATFEQYGIPVNIVGDQAKFLKEGMMVQVVMVEEEALGIELPMSLIYTVTETGPEEKGNTVSNVFKDATLDNGLAVKVPMYMKQGEKIKVDTRSGEYIERVK
ncbi:elongation factor P [Candidatus Daviesbacteria bacterium RIFCSPHIGHO2_01_FULL_44_29]|uniref:Elongation factor P n=1 Tax=Candidatus Daviesbacteria bacterium RIFCSPHIGHO2_02_FULL_43_12 TaxID=1797776 RepID=A0A1F5KHY9_9BACT|nr:MAG: elongation factor P [Candidatus Daviesbacteria bacterium RIFCSPHIGHO2_01_FULL_44_29]OGE40440.1 MAG: elongation factor P [Candidatus Daviesbacteria bacterium RIFCSPHIGHO2_02_FULL_43_12]OGE69712.1 MAG: elongation factor P [Candidatus Daviesbacteria bacterium RIFCSPLOWO2_01_FULL_43_15]